MCFETLGGGGGKSHYLPTVSGIPGTSMQQINPKFQINFNMLGKSWVFSNTKHMKREKQVSVCERTNPQLFNGTLDLIIGSILVENEFIKVASLLIYF